MLLRLSEDQFWDMLPKATGPVFESIRLGRIEAGHYVLRVPLEVPSRTSPLGPGTIPVRIRYYGGGGDWYWYYSTDIVDLYVNPHRGQPSVTLTYMFSIDANDYFYRFTVYGEPIIIFEPLKGVTAEDALKHGHYWIGGFRLPDMGDIRLPVHSVPVMSIPAVEGV